MQHAKDMYIAFSDLQEIELKNEKAKFVSARCGRARITKITSSLAIGIDSTTQNQDAYRDT